MDTTEIGCIVAGTVAIGLLASKNNNFLTSGRRTRFRGSSRAASACSSMRSKVSEASASAKAQTLS